MGQNHHRNQTETKRQKTTKTRKRRASLVGGWLLVQVGRTHAHWWLRHSFVKKVSKETISRQTNRPGKNYHTLCMYNNFKNGRKGTREGRAKKHSGVSGVFFFFFFSRPPPPPPSYDTKFGNVNVSQAHQLHKNRTAESESNGEGGGVAEPS